MTWELSVLLKATVLLGVGLAAVGVARRTRASRRHLILASAFVALILLPVAVTLVPAVPVALPLGEVTNASADEQQMAVIRSIRVPPSPSDGAGRLPAWSLPSPTTTLRGLWALGAAGVLAMLASTLWNLRRLRRSGVPWIAGQTMTGAIAEEAGFNRRVTVIVHDRVRVPATIGFLRPVILLPPDARQWTEVDLRRAFLHELEHARRGDWWIHLAARMVCSTYWFHPLVWIAWRQLGIEAERACDDAVVSDLDRTGYADQLVALATRLSTPNPQPLLSMASRSDLSVRVRAILNPGQRRGRAGRLVAAMTLGIVALMVGVVASLHTVAEARSAANDESALGTRAAPAVTNTRDATSPQAAPAAELIATPAAAPRTTQRPATPASAPETGRPLSQVSAAGKTRTQYDIESMRRLSQASSSATTVTQPDAYVVGPEDVLVVTSWRNRDLSLEVVVRNDGKITLPLINDIMAAGLTPDQLRANVIAAWQPFVQSPEVTVVVKAINSRRVFVMGKVGKQGGYSLAGPMTVVQLLAMAGGLDDFAKRDAIFIVRQVDGKNVNVPFDYTALINGQKLEQNILLKPGDTVVVP